VSAAVVPNRLGDAPLLTQAASRAMGTRSAPHFSTPSEYLDYLRRAHARRSVHASPDHEMLRLTRLDMETLGVSLPDPTSPYDMVVRHLADRVAAGFSSRCGIDVATSCAIGPLDDSSVNARCFRSAEGHYAIVLHHGLMNILHKHSKLLTAAVNPSSVVYCNRKDPAELTSQELVSWAQELGSIYRTIGETKGAMVKLDRQASVIATTTLTMGEAFVLGHEIGHFVAGHLENDSRFVPDQRFPWLEFFAENPMHQDEFEADRHGFEAMRDHIESISKPMLLGALVSTFATLSLIGAGATSESHPSAMDRIHQLVEDHFSAGTAKLVRRWIDDGDHQAAAEALTTAH
jgi:hypothetical protein